jgi:HPt (histidine-containing phosphotransfer) domain-containing protein
MTNPASKDAPYRVQADSLVLPLVPGYLANRAVELPKLDAALAARDFPLLRKIGHNLRGSAGAYGLPPLSLIGAQIEDAAVAQDAGAIAPLLDELRRFLKTVELPR